MSKDKKKNSPKPARGAKKNPAPVVAGTRIEPTPATVEPKKDVASDPVSTVDSTQSPNVTQDTSGENPGKEPTMTLKFEKLSKSGNFAIYSGLRTTIRIATTAFVDKKPLPTFEVAGEFAGPRQVQTKMTKEERKAYRLANPKPKPTLAELIAKREKALAALKAKASGELQPA